MEEIIKRQREYFNTGATLNYKFRINQLKCIKNLITEYQSDIVEAFGKDYNKCEFDVYSTEIGMTVHELDYLISHLKSLMRPKRKCTSVINFPSKGYIVPEPYGVVLVVAPWNYPFQLSILPMIGAIAAGNTVILKLSANTPNISAVISSMLSSFPQEYIYTTWDNLSEREQLFEGKYDYIFYTGSTGVARTLMEKQGRNIVPVTLELGGKSPCIIDRDANIDKSAKRVVWGKFLNAGQTCVAPDYVVIERSIKEKWLESALYYIDYFYYEQGTDAVRRLKEDFPWLVTRKSVDRLLDFCNNAMVL
ncbi:MAG: aldehyde dehydrogenase family protein, partial [Bacteroidales bacterium]|nr:aldehyde dehydrogenase family protein [Bacteroidales bacterium]